jgi:peroxiredoxin
MKKILLLLTVAISFLACNQNDTKGKFTVHGEIKNTEDQKIYLEQLFFNEKNPEVLDTADIKAGKFDIEGIASEQGLYRLRLEKQNMGYVFVNDKNNIQFIADAKDVSLQGPSFATPANNEFKNLITALENKKKVLTDLATEIDNLKTDRKNDSIVKIKYATLNEGAVGIKKFILQNIDSTISNPVVAALALGFTSGIDTTEVKALFPKLQKKFPAQRSIQDVIATYTKMIAPQQKATNDPAKPAPSNNKIGAMAPEITMADTTGKPFSLSSLKGKYVLVDFWASWCMPCRGENPNVVANYNKYKNKNFTVLGVSLDEDKTAWTKAIIKDKLAWKQVSDLKGWACAATATYGFDAIPYNVLLDPSGKIIATELRDEELGKKLAEVLR